MHCIFCRQEHARSEEHVFPDAIGGTLTIDRVCKTCNDQLGAGADASVTEHIGVRMMRFLLALPNRDGKTLRFEDIVCEGVLANDPDQRFRMVRDADGGVAPQLIYKSSRRSLGDGREQIQITIDASARGEIAKIIERTRKREKLPALTPDALQAEVFAAFSDEKKVENPEVIWRPTIDFVAYRKGLYKIAYELAWLWLGDAYLDDPIAVRLRNIICDGADDTGLRGAYQLDGEATESLRLWCGSPNAHVAFAQKGPGFVAITVRVFNVMSVFMVVTEHPENYPAFSDGLFFYCDPKAKTSRRTTLPEEIRRLSQDTLAWGVTAPF